MPDYFYVHLALVLPICIPHDKAAQIAMQLFHGSIRKKLVVLVLLATTPVFLVLLGTELLNRKHTIRDTKKDAATSLHSFAEIQRRTTDSTKTLLRTLASMPEIRDANVERSQIILSTLLETNPIYTNAILVDLKGDVVAAGRNHDKASRFNFADRKQFKEAITSKGFASGEFVVGKSSKKAIFPFGMAVLDEQGTPKGAIIIGVSLKHYGGLFESGSYGTGTFFGLCDQKGIRLFRHPYSAQTPVGEPIRNEVFNAARSIGGPGSVSAQSSDGLKRVIVFEPLRLEGNQDVYMYMFMGLEYSQIMQQANSILLRVAITSFSSLALALAIARIIGGRGIASRIEQLTEATKKIGFGEKNIATEIDYSDGEIGYLAQSFDNMVLTLRLREDERNKALLQLGASEKRFRELIEDVSAISIQGYDENRMVTFWNYASETLYGYTKEEALGKKIDHLIIPKFMRETVEKQHTGWLEEGIKIPPGEIVLMDKSGSDVPVFSSHVMHTTKFGKEMYRFDIDMKPLKESEEDKLQLLNRLRQSQKIEAIGTLASGIAHDFNNILVPILGYSEMILAEHAEGADLNKEGIAQIYSSALRAKELVQQILTFSRHEVTEYTSVKIQSTLREVVRLLQSTLPRNIKIVQRVDPHCRPINGDVTQLHQIIMNLATNAFHAMGEAGGTLTLSLKEQNLSPATAKSLSIGSGEVICLIVTDTGIGMDRDVIEKIFNPFFTTKEKGKGTGIGLSVVHGIVKNMNGCITVTSHPGQGTEFTIFFPIEEKAVTEREGDDIATASTLSGTEHILIVDDEAPILQITKLSLEKLGYKVTAEINPLKAFSTFENAPGNFDLVVTDVSMPSISGDVLAGKLLEIRPDIPIILCTGYSEKVTPQKARSIGIKEILIKPVLPNELARKIRLLLTNVIARN